MPQHGGSWALPTGRLSDKVSGAPGITCNFALRVDRAQFFGGKEINMSKEQSVTLARLTPEDREQFILDNQESFRYGALQEFGVRDDHVGEDGEIISRETIEQSIDAPENEAYRILLDGRAVGGAVLKINAKTHHNALELLFVNPSEHSRGIGSAAWRAVEALHPETEVWETCTPYFEKRNIHFISTNAGFTPWSFSTRTIPLPAIPTVVPTRMRDPMRCSALKR